MGTELLGRSNLIKAQFSALDTAAERGTLNETEATHLRACAQPADIDKVRSCGLRRHAICISVTINWRWDPGGDVHAHHTASLTLAPKCHAFA